MKTYGGSLPDESDPAAWGGSIANSCPLTTETINDVTSLIPLSPINLLTMKSNIMPPPGVFASPYKYCRKHCTRVQHIYLQWVLEQMEERGVTKSSIQNKME